MTPRTKKPTPKDVAQVIDPMTKPDPLYAITCNAHGKAYGFGRPTPARFYGKPGWPPPEGPWEPEDLRPWTPWSERTEP